MKTKDIERAVTDLTGDLEVIGHKTIDGEVKSVRIPNTVVTNAINTAVSTSEYSSFIIDHEHDTLTLAGDGTMQVYHIVLSTLAAGEDTIQISNVSEIKALQPTLSDTKFLHVSGSQGITVYCETPTVSTLVLYKLLGSAEIPN